MSKLFSLATGLFSGGASIFSSIGIYALVLLVGLSAGTYAGYKIESAVSAQAEVKAMNLAEAKYTALARHEDAVAVEYEQRLVAAKAQQLVVTQTVEKIVTRPVYNNVCLDADGLKAANEALTGRSSPAGKVFK